MTHNNVARKMVAPAFLASLGFVASLYSAPPAEACGGFFCNRPPPPPPGILISPPPVVQTAENVLFAMDRTPRGNFRLEAHVQIFYMGSADRFSWVVPVDSQPELDVGSNAVFAQIDPMTRPSFSVAWKDEGVCRVDQPSGRDQGGPTGAGTGGAGGNAGFVGDAAAPPGVSVAFRGDVGPYDAAVIKSTSTTDAKPLLDWLNDNKYFVSPEGQKLIEDYVREDKYFVAIRLISGKDVNEIAPLVMRFEGPGPCVPLRLTSIASIRDLQVNLWVLGESRVVPANFFEIKINPARIDWFGGGRNYEDLVKRAADEAGGNAFVVDYVGPASIAKGRLYPAGRYNIPRIAMMRTPPTAVAEVSVQGIPRDGTLLGILQKHIPEPEVLRQMGISEIQFYAQLPTYWASYQRFFAPFDAAAFAADIDVKIVKPLEKAQALFDRFGKLSRLSTFISPEEMNVDPLFVMNPTLPDVPAQRMSAAYRMCGNMQFSRCNAPVRLELPDGQKLYFMPRPWNGPCYSGQSATSFDRGDLDKLPALEVSYSRTQIGEGAIRVQNGPIIADAISAHNRKLNPAIAGGLGRNTGGSPVTMDGTAMPTTGSDEVSGGFGCALAGAPRAGEDLVVLFPALGAAGLVALARRRRRR